MYKFTNKPKTIDWFVYESLLSNLTFYLSFLVLLIAYLRNFAFNKSNAKILAMWFLEKNLSSCANHGQIKTLF